MSRHKPSPAEIAEQDERYKDRMITLQVGLWSTIAALDGLFISAASIMVSLDPSSERWPFNIIIGCSILSLLCILHNFHGLTKTHYFLADSPEVDGMTDQ